MGCSGIVPELPGALNGTPRQFPAVTTAKPTTSVVNRALSESDWRTQANAICADTGPKISAAFAALDPTAPTPEQIDNVVRTLVSVNRDTETRIGELGEPATLTAQVKELLDANEAATKQGEQLGSAALDSAQQLFAPVNELATKLGLPACAG